jgi:hypothetical protein
MERELVPSTNLATSVPPPSRPSWSSPKLTDGFDLLLVNSDCHILENQQSISPTSSLQSDSSQHLSLDVPRMDRAERRTTIYDTY